MIPAERSDTAEIESSGEQSELLLDEGSGESSTCPEIDECPLGPPGWGETGGSYDCTDDTCEYICADGGPTGIRTSCSHGRWSDPDMSKIRRANCHVCDAENMPWNYSPTGYFVGVDGPGSWDCSWSANRVIFCDASCAARDVDLVIGCNRNAGTGIWFQVSGSDDANCNAVTTEEPTTTEFVPDDNGFCGDIPEWENFEGGSWICDSDEQNENTKCDWICNDGMQIKKVS